jgi:hypothetical protein
MTHAAAIPARYDALAYLLLRMDSFGGSLFSAFYGFANIVFGWLIYRSRYIPRVFGVGMGLTGVAFAVRTVGVRPPTAPA